MAESGGGEGAPDDPDVPALDPLVARWTADELAFPLQRRTVAWSAVGLAAAAALTACMIPVPATADMYKLGLPARWTLAGCALFFAGMCGYAVVTLVRDRPVLVVDRTGLRRGSRTITWDRLSSIRFDSEQVGRSTFPRLVIHSRSDRPIRMYDRQFGCSIKTARVLIRRWAIEHVDETLFGGIVDPAGHEAVGMATLQEIARSVIGEASGTSDDDVRR